MGPFVSAWRQTAEKTYVLGNCARFVTRKETDLFTIYSVQLSHSWSRPKSDDKGILPRDFPDQPKAGLAGIAKSKALNNSIIHPQHLVGELTYQGNRCFPDGQ